MSKPCAVFWDIQNINVPKGRSVDFIVNQIRSTIVKAYNLHEIFFFCISDVHKLSSKVGRSLTNLDVDIVQPYSGVKVLGDSKKTNLMRKFVKLAGQECAVILISGHADYHCVLSDLKKLYNVSIHLIRLANSCSSKLEQVSDYTYTLDNGVLKPMKSTGLPMYFISFMNYPLTMDISQMMKGLNGQATGSIPNSAILHGNLIYIGFPTLWNAEKAIESLNQSRYHGHFLKVESVVNSPLTDILKCIKPNLIVQSKYNKEVKQLTFIKMSNQNGNVDIRKVISFCVTCTAQTSSQCILSRESFLWIVFLFKSDAQKCLAKIQMLYPDAVISEPPNDLTLSYYENPYIVEPCEIKVTNKESPVSDVNNSKKVNVEPDEQVESQDSSFDSICYLEGFPNVGHRLEDLMESETQNADTDTHCDNDWKLFFRLSHSVSTDMLYYQPTKWSLLYNLFEQLYDLGVKKVMYDGLYYCAHFDSVTRCLIAFAEMRSRYLDPLEFVLAPEVHKKEVSKKMERYVSAIPWCLNEELDLHCLVIKMDSHYHDCFIEIRKKILGNLDCIFIKSTPEAIWIGFPDENICKSSEKALGIIESFKKKTDIFIAKPSNLLLECINYSDLVGDAYDLAFLANQLETSKSIMKPRIIEQINLQRTEPQEWAESVYHISVRGYFSNQKSWARLSLPQIVKILVKFSKVIPLAATASYIDVNFMFNSWYEAHAARHFLNKLTLPEVPYFEELNGVSEVMKDKGIWHEFSEFFIINDKRKVLDKIVQNQSLMDRLASSPSTVESTFEIDAADEEIMKQIDFFYAISTNSEFKFTPGMMSIVKMKLVQMDCPVFVEFKDKIWVGVDDFVRGSMAKIRVDQTKFKILHENDEDDFEVGVLMLAIPRCPEIVAKMLAKKLIKMTRAIVNRAHLNSNAIPLGHFNYNYRKAVGMTTSQYCRLYESF